MNGVVKTYDPRRGMGELAPDDGSPDVTVFVSEIERAGLARLSPGDRLSFSVQSDKMLRRKYAVNLKSI
ncbi:MAG: cold shock domain-containing protein [Alphaproteobacteria bacterium]